MPNDTDSLYDLIRLVRPLYKVLETAVALELEPTGVGVLQRAILEQLLDNGDLTVPAIGRNLILPRQFIQKNANELHAAGLVTKRENAAHKRSVLFALTPRGRELIGRIRAREAEVMAPIAERLDGGDLKAAKAVMTEMIRSFAEHNRQRERAGRNQGDHDEHS